MMVHWKDKHIVRIAVPLIILLLVVTGALYASTYGYFVRLYSQAVCEKEIDVLRQKNNSFIYLTENIKSLISTMRMNPKIMALGYEDDMDLHEELNAQNQLDSVRMSSDMIQSIYLFNQKVGKVYVTMDQGNRVYKEEEFFDKNIYSYLSEINFYGTYTPNARRITLPNGKTKDVLTFCVYDYFKQTQYIDGVIVINVSQDWLIKNLDVDGSIASTGKRVMLIDNKGLVTFSTKSDEFLEDKSGQSHVGRVMAETEDAGFFTDEIDGEKFLITFLKEGYSDWIFVGMSHYSQIVAQLRPIQLFTAGVSAAVFIAGLALVMLLARRLAVNMKNMEQQVMRLEDENRTYATVRRDRFLYTLMKDGIGQDGNMEEMFGEYELHIKPMETFLIVLLEVDRFSAFCKSNNLDERNLKMRRLLLLAEGQFGKECPCDAGVLSESQIAVLCNPAGFPEAGHIVEKITNRIRALQETVEKELTISISASVSELGDTYRELPELFEEVLDNLQYRYLLGYRAVIFPFMVPSKKSGLPVSELKQEEEKLISILFKMKFDETEAALQDYIDKLSVLPSYEIKLFLLNMLMQVKSKVVKGNILLEQEQSDMQSLLDDITKAETLDESHHIIKAFFEEITGQLAQQRQRKYQSMVENTKDYIEKNYMMENISINAIADMEQLSVAYMGKIFKQLEGISVAEYIMQVRLRHAVDLLVNSGISVNAIAGKVGFVNSSYFYYVFKKEFAVTPNQYRLQYKEK